MTVRLTTWIGIGALGLSVLAGGGAAGAVPLDEGIVRQVAVGHVAALLAGQGRLEVEAGAPAALGPLAGRDVEIRPRLLKPLQPTGDILVRLDFWSDGRRLGQRVVAVRARVFGPVVVTTRTVPRHERLDAADLTLEERDRRSLSRGFFESTGAVTGMRTAQRVAAGAALAPRDVERIPVIARGDKVTVQVVVAGVSVSVTGTALKDGGAGEEIAVRNDRSGRRLQAVVVDAGLARVVLGPGARIGGRR